MPRAVSTSAMYERECIKHWNIAPAKNQEEVLSSGHYRIVRHALPPKWTKRVESPIRNVSTSTCRNPRCDCPNSLCNEHATRTMSSIGRRSTSAMYPVMSRAVRSPRQNADTRYTDTSVAKPCRTAASSAQKTTGSVLCYKMSAPDTDLVHCEVENGEKKHTEAELHQELREGQVPECDCEEGTKSFPQLIPVRRRGKLAT